MEQLSWREWKENVRALVLAPVAVALAAMLASFWLSLYWHEADEIAQESERVFRAVPAGLNEEMSATAGWMETVMEALDKDDGLASLFLARDMEAVRRRMKPLYEKMTMRGGVTHFYFLDPRRVCLLRMHRPERRGDTIDRFTAVSAERTGRVSSGLELGPLGTFSLRVVRPWKRQGRLIGYLELSEKVDRITAHLHEALGLESVVVLYKDLLEREGWREGSGAAGGRDDWDAFKDFVVAGRTLRSVPRELVSFLGRDGRGIPSEIREGSSRFVVRSQGLVDASGRQVGKTVFLRDVTAEYAALRRTVAAGAVACLAVGAGLFALLFGLLGRIDAALKSQAADLRSSKDFLQSVLDAIPRMITVVGLDYRVLLANKLARRFNGMKEGPFDGLKCHEMTHQRGTPCAGADCPCPLDRVVATKSSVVMTHIHEDAQRRKAAHELTAAPILDGAGQVAQVVIVSEDLSQRERRIDLSRATT